MDLIGTRIKSARERLGLTQSDLASRLGFRDRQTLTAIETGKRKLSAEELLRAAGILGLDLDYFTDSYRLDEGNFSWRADVDASTLREFEEQSRRWLALYKNLADGEVSRRRPMRLALTAKSSFEDAQLAADWLVSDWSLGEYPALRLEPAINEKLRTLVLYVDAPQGISGAACDTPGLTAILINRAESPGRRNYNLAHELFHLLTWDTLPPAYQDSSQPADPKKKRIEQLANSFASALLMPAGTLFALRNTPEVSQKWVQRTAEAFVVTIDALAWRLVNLGWIDRQQAETFIRSLTSGDITDVQQLALLPKRFAHGFVLALEQGLLKGHVSVRRVATLLGLSIGELASLFPEHELAVPFDF